MTTPYRAESKRRLPTAEKQWILVLVLNCRVFFFCLLGSCWGWGVLFFVSLVVGVLKLRVSSNPLSTPLGKVPPFHSFVCVSVCGADLMRCGYRV